MTTGEKINKLAAIKRQSLANEKRIEKLLKRQDKLVIEGSIIFRGISSADKALFCERLTKIGYPC